jgi:hypothetical protein
LASFPIVSCSIEPTQGNGTPTPAALRGGRDWRELPAAKQAAGKVADATPDKIVRSFVSKFKRKLADAGFRFQDEAVPLFTNTKNAQMYHLLYCSHDSTGLKIWQGIKRIGPGGQRSLLGMD